MKKLFVTLACGAALLCAASHGAAPVVTPLGAYSTSLRAPARLAADAVGNLYVVDPLAGKVIVFDAFGRLMAIHSGLRRPLGIAVDSQGRIYLGEEQAGSISVFDKQWNLLYKLGDGDGEFGMPNYIAIDPTSNTVFVSDSAANEIKVYDGGLLANRFGALGTLDGEFDFPAGVAISAGGEVSVVDQNNDRVQVFDRGGIYLRQVSFRSGNRTGRRQGLVVDNSGRIYVADSFQGTVTAYDATTGATDGAVGTFGVLAGQLNLPAAVAIDPYNRLYVTSAGNGRVELYGLDTYLHLTMEPAGSTVAAGTSLVLKALAGGPGPFSFQWQKDFENLIEDGGISGTTNSVLTVTGLSIADAGGYSVIVTGPAGTITGSLAQVSVQAPPEILSGPYAATVLRGSRVEFAISATGSDLSYQWQHEGLDVEGATNSAMVLENVQTYDAGQYVAVIKNAVGSISSAPARLAVLVPPQVMEFLGIATPPGFPSVLTINSDAGVTYALDVSSNLYDWAQYSIFTNDAGGIVDLIGADVTNALQQFYRLRWAGSFHDPPIQGG